MLASCQMGGQEQEYWHICRNGTDGLVLDRGTGKLGLYSVQEQKYWYGITEMDRNRKTGFSGIWYCMGIQRSENIWLSMQARGNYYNLLVYLKWFNRYYISHVIASQSLNVHWFLFPLSVNCHFFQFKTTLHLIISHTPDITYYCIVQDNEFYHSSFSISLESWPQIQCQISCWLWCNNRAFVCVFSIAVCCFDIDIAAHII